jgi:hypothetical protein
MIDVTSQSTRTVTLTQNPDVPDGKSYVDAATAAGQRSRALVYFILILTVLTFASLRNSYAPDWTARRFKALQEVQNCYIRDQCEKWDKRLMAAGLMPPQATDEQKATARASAESRLEFDFSGLRTVEIGTSSAAAPDSKTTDDVDLRRQEFELAVQALQKKDLDNDTITLPVLGSAIDINDLWIASGAMMFFLLHFLRTSLEQEYRNIRYIINHKPQFATLAVMNQVLAPHAINIGQLGRAVEFCVVMLPSILYFYLCYLDWDSLLVSFLYIGRSKTYLEFGLEILLSVMVCYVNIRCRIVQTKIRENIRPFSTQIEQER